MRLLVLGGTSFVGRTVVTEAIDRGWSVVTFNRGHGTWSHPAADRIVGDRLDRADVAGLAGGRWDAVVDTWQGAPYAVRDSARFLAERAARYVYVSSRAVYAFPTPPDMDESSPTVDADPNAGEGEYARNKRGAELAVEESFGDRALLARAGLILGPYEDAGRLASWLKKANRGGKLLAPGPAHLPFRFIDVRDLSEWLLDAIEDQISGPVNLVNPPGHATTKSFLDAVVSETGGHVTLEWITPEDVTARGLHRWTDLPGWIPPEPRYAGLIATNTRRAERAGLRCRSIRDTVRDTWTWLCA